MTKYEYAVLKQQLKLKRKLVAKCMARCNTKDNVIGYEELTDEQDEIIEEYVAIRDEFKSIDVNELMAG